MSSGDGLRIDLELVIRAGAVRVLAVAAVGRTPRELDERRVPRLGAEHAQERGRVERAGADLDVDGLLDDTAALGPEPAEREDEVLQVHARAGPYRRGGLGVKPSP